jgi:hypothetical protein
VARERLFAKLDEGMTLYYAFYRLWESGQFDAILQDDRD